MTYARQAANAINAYCRLKWPDKGFAYMASHWANGNVIDAFDHQGSVSHKSIPADQLTRDLGEPEGAGVFGAWLMKDGSYLLLTCQGPLAHWSGKTEDAAAWGEFA